MKRTLTQIILSASLGLAVQAQTNMPPPAGGGGGTLPEWSAWTVTAMDDCSTTRELKGSVTNELTGVVTPRSNRIIELATGLNYLDSSGVLTESQDLVEPLANGGAAAVHGRYSAYFSPAGLNDDAALTITTPIRVYQARVLGIYYFDTQSGQSNLLATPSDTAVAEILPPNQIVFRGAFNSPKLKADLRYTYTKAAFESDVIITSQPKVSPADCGLNPDTTVIQVRHQWLGASMPKIQEVTVAQGPGPDLVDQILDFGDLWFPRGRAFAWADDAGRGTNAAQISLPGVGGLAVQAPVAKAWQAAGSKATLIESVTWDSIAPMLTQLPTMAKVVRDPMEARLAAAGLQEAAPNGRAGARRTMEVAARPYRTPGVVLDYITVVLGTGSYHFTNYSPSGPLYNPSGGTTFEVRGNCYFNGTLTFDAGCVVKFSHNDQVLLTYAGIVCNYTSGVPSVLTSICDPVYGDPIVPGAPAQAAATALWLYYLTTNVTVNGIAFRYATTALQACDNGGATVANCSFFNCQTGIWADYYSVTIQNSTCCVVNTPTSYYGYFTGSLTAESAPTITTLPLCQLVLPNNSVSFTAAASPTNLTYTWSLDHSLNQVYVVGTNASVTIYPAQLGTNYGGQKVRFYATGPYGSAEAAAWVGIVDSSALAVANHWTNYTNTKDCILWDQRTTNNNTPTLKWHTNSLLYGKTGFTAISQRDDWNWWIPGQLPVTALTPRHGYMRGHGTAGTTDYVAFAGSQTNYNGQHVYFCTSNNTVVTATVTNGCTRCWGSDHLDYTILIFNADLPSTIHPMAVSYTNPTTFSIIFNTAQGGYMSANNPPFWLINSVGDQASDPDAFPPFNEYPTVLPGDSGSPAMLPETDDVLVFLYGTTTSPPSTQMQLDMNILCTSVGIEGEDYQMTVRSVQ